MDSARVCFGFSFFIIKKAAWCFLLYSFVGIGAHAHMVKFIEYALGNWKTMVSRKKRVVLLLKRLWRKKDYICWI